MTKCLGCGIKLQSEFPNKLGYSFNVENDICERCFKLKHYGKYENVTLENDDYLKILNSIDSDHLVVYTTDVLNLSINLMDNFSRVLLVVTKRDILPKSVKDEKIVDYVKKRFPNVIDVVVISSIKNYKIDYFYEKIKKYCNNLSVYFVGNTNTGKSTLINKLIDNYSNKENIRVTTSMYPSTTLDKVSINLGEVTLIDTPGLIDSNSIFNILDGKDIKKITIKKEMKPKSCQINGIGSIIIDKYVRVDYKTTKRTSLVIYASNALEMRFSSIKREVFSNFVENEFDLVDNQDIVIPGLGFIKFTDSINVKIYCDGSVKPYVRDNLI